MTHVVRGPDGREWPFPDEMPDDQVNAEMLKRYPQYTGGTLKNRGLPQAGAATPAGGAVMPTMQGGVPDYRSDEDWENIMLGMIMPRGAASLIGHTPGHEMRERYAQGVGTNMAKLEERQRAGDAILDEFHRTLRAIGNQAYRSGTLNQMIGPVNSSEWFQRAREAGNFGNWMGTQQSHERSKEFEHAAEALADQLIAAGVGGQQSDQRVKLFLGAIQKAREANTPEGFMNIMHHAEDLLRGMFELPNSYVPRRQRLEMMEAQAAGTPYIPPWDRPPAYAPGSLSRPTAQAQTPAPPPQMVHPNGQTYTLGPDGLYHPPQ